MEIRQNRNYIAFAFRSSPEAHSPKSAYAHFFAGMTFRQMLKIKQIEICALRGGAGKVWPALTRRGRPA